ncbi:hypothetical protein Tc00.1047053506813.10 [Trypanosoma cruzi]|uniref:Retrotransposon hot spot protein (RHS) n=1 Tax=Trypanosoma cruzi (strain CL Brener) TaxID=353153 RepID=Q4DY93_TRYCC|nr:hypothetical protein Tc00.1047053506813.10 [Trypanosoma cruzi]EAN97488.1 hypothetical protein Tc00.1047053506813.10 [Trypanosoma cruzi]|eukprot:XP_819339.1 hypothetical protein [Trypanosoma cruzi strain CL Brener]
MSLSGLLVVVSVMRLRCTFLCVPPHTLLPLFCFFALCCCRHTQPHTHKVHIAVDLNAPFVVHAGSCVWRLLSSSVAMRRRERGARSPSLFFCGCDAPRATALSWAPCPIDGGMAGNFVPRDGWMRVRLLRVRCVVAAGFCHFPGAAGMSWGRWWWMSSPPAWWVAAGVVCLPCVDAVSWCVNCAAGPAALSSCCLLSRCIRCAPSLSLPFHSFPFRRTDQLTDTSDSTTGDDDCDGDGAAPCWSLRSCAAAARPCA